MNPWKNLARWMASELRVARRELRVRAGGLSPVRWFTQGFEAGREHAPDELRETRALLDAKTFEATVTIDRPGTYLITVDLREGRCLDGKTRRGTFRVQLIAT